MEASKDQVLNELQQLIIEHGLPKVELALYGIRCPYCGKSDRIRQLDAPAALNGDLTRDVLARYARLWRILAKEDEVLAICRFCLNPIKLDLENAVAEPLSD